MRGKAVLELLLIDNFGITPACAGKSDGYTAGRTDARDHPRVCGEKPALPPGVLAPPGSPPRMRGKDYVAHACKGRVGITPAYAGKSMAGSSLGFDLQDHPRVCGEKLGEKKHKSVILGSPPRMRGKAAYSLPTRRMAGITPAYAGKRAAKP